MKYPLFDHPQHEVLATSSRRAEWGWCGFGAGMLLYVVLSVVFGSVPDDAALKAAWLGVGLVPSVLGSCLGLTLALVLD
jgi:hypothetical protein